MRNASPPSPRTATTPESPRPHDAAGDPASTGRLRRLRLLIAYDGAPFSGFARQPGRRTVQGDVERVLTRLAGHPVTTVGAGRTDTGVHARGQVMHADVPGRLQPGRVATSLTTLLAPVLTVRAAAWAPTGFDARFSARRRTYVYRIDDSDIPDPLHATWVLRWKQPLDLGSMRAAARHLLGGHDFASFCRTREGATSIRHLRAVTVWRRDGLVHVEAVADAFCHQMVRSVVGMLLDVGSGRRPASWAADVLAARDRGALGTIALPHGLVLESVTYDPPWPARG